jgi:hypothetical protein
MHVDPLIKMVRTASIVTASSPVDHRHDLPGRDGAGRQQVLDIDLVALLMPDPATVQARDHLGLDLFETHQLPLRN